LLARLEVSGLTHSVFVSIQIDLCFNSDQTAAVLGDNVKGLNVRVRRVVRVGEDDGELRPWQYIYVYSIESRLIMIVRR